MSHTFRRHWIWKLTLPAAAGLVLALVGGPLAAQVKDKDAQPEKEQVKEERLGPPRITSRTLIRAGYTRPGNPNDILKDGKVIPIAWNDDFKGRYMGATVYFAVYERLGTSERGDAFGTGNAKVDETFKEGRSGNGRYSPAFDTNARYLYVYQVVNDRGLDPKKELPIGAAWRDFRSEDIVTATVKLLVDPREITSWGHFSNVAFASRVTDRDLRGQVQLAADGKSDRMLTVALSASPSVIDALPNREYQAIAPAFGLGELKNYFSMERSNLNLLNTKAFKEIDQIKAKEKGVKLVAWQENMLTAAKGGLEPAYVQIEALSGQPFGLAISGVGLDADGLPELWPVGQNPARGYLKVDWRGDQIVKLGEHSVAFGFTSNLPPAEEVVRVISAVKEKGAGQGDDGIVAAALVDGNGPGVAAGQAVGPGTVPTPIGVPASCVGAGSWIGSPFGFGGGGGGGFGGGFGGFGGPRGPIMGGGGGGGGGGSGHGNAGNGQTGNQTQTINFSPVLINQQAQFQLQAQAQAQTQAQFQAQACNNNNNHHGAVVPEPAAIALGLLGLPALYFVLRRRKAAAAPTPAPNC